MIYQKELGYYAELVGTLHSSKHTYHLGGVAEEIPESIKLEQFTH